MSIFIGASVAFGGWHKLWVEFEMFLCFFDCEAGSGEFGLNVKDSPGFCSFECCLEGGGGIVDFEPHWIVWCVLCVLGCGKISEAEAGYIDFPFACEFSAGEFAEVLCDDQAFGRGSWSPVLSDCPIFVMVFKESERACVDEVFHVFGCCCGQEVIGASGVVVDNVAVGVLGGVSELGWNLGDMDNNLYAAY